MKFNKSHMSLKKQMQQRLKGTYDSPCVSICDFDPTSLQCLTCKLLKSEKRSWIKADKKVKSQIKRAVINRVSKRAKECS